MGELRTAEGRVCVHHRPTNPRAEPGCVRELFVVQFKAKFYYPIHRAITKDLVAVGMIQPGLICGATRCLKKVPNEALLQSITVKVADGCVPVLRLEELQKKAEHEELVDKQATRTAYDKGHDY